MEFLYVFAKTVSLVITVVTEMMFLRAVLSWFADPDGRLCVFLEMMTEPFIKPVRFLLSLCGVGEDSPVDVAFFVTYLFLIMAEIFLPAL